MSTERIDSIYDLAAIQAEQDKFIAFLKESKDAIIDLNNQRITLKDTDIASFSKVAEGLNKTITQSATATQKASQSFTELGQSVKAHENNLKSLAAVQVKGIALTSDTAIEIQKVNLQNQAQAKANKEVAASVLGLVDDYGLLKKQYDQAANAAKNLSAIALRTGSGDDNLAASNATAKAKALHDSLLQIEQGVGQSQRNVGNYTGALKILEVALVDAKAKLDSLTSSERQNTSAGQALTKEVSLLSTLAGQQAAGFVSLRREVLSSKQALSALESQGLEGTAAFKQLQTEVSHGSRSLNEFNKQQKLLSSESPALAALTATAKGLGAAYAIGAGASSLFADGNEHVEKELNKLVAIMTVLQGLTEFNAFLQEKSAIKTALLNSVIAIKNFVLTGSTKAQIESNVATIEGAAAEEVLGVATVEASAAMKIFRTALIATGIGILIVALIALYENFDKIKIALGFATKAQKDYNDTLDDFKKGVTDAREKLDKVKVAFDEARQGVISKKEALKVYNDTLGDTFGQMNNLADAEKAYTDKAPLYIQVMGLKAQANALFSKSGEALARGITDAKKNELGFIDKLSLSIKPEAFFGGITKKQMADHAKGLLEESQKDSKDLFDQGEKLAIEADKLAKGAGITLDKPDKQKETKEKKSKEDNFLEESLKRTKEYNKKTQEEISKASETELKELNDKYQSEYNNQDLSFNERLAALQKFYEASTKLNNEVKQRELASNNELAKQEDDKANESFGKSRKTKEEKVQLSKELLSIESNRIANENKINAEGNKSNNDSRLHFAAEAIKIVKEEYKDMVDAAKLAYAEIARIIEKQAKDATSGIEIEKDKKLIQLDKDFYSGKIKNKEDFNELKQAIEDNSQIQDLQADEARILQLEKFFGKSLSLEKEFYDDEAKMAEINYIKKKEASDKKHLEDLDNLQTFSNATLDLEQTIGDASFTKQKNKVAAEQTAADEKEKRDIEAVTVSARTEQQKADAISIIQARSEQEKKARDARQRKLDYEKAKFDKEIAILTIVAQIAIDIAKSAFDPRAAAAAALAGVALIKLIATPIPHYRYGRGEGKEEFAKVGEGGVHEYIHRASGVIEKTPAVETLTHLMPKDRVYKNKETLIKELTLSMMPLSDYRVNKDGSIDKHSMEKMTSQIVDAVDNIKVQTTLITKEGWRNVNTKISKTEQWVQKNIKD